MKLGGRNAAKEADEKEVLLRATPSLTRHLILIPTPHLHLRPTRDRAMRRTSISEHDQRSNCAYTASVDYGMQGATELVQVHNVDDGLATMGMSVGSGLPGDGPFVVESVGGLGHSVSDEVPSDIRESFEWHVDGFARIGFISRVGGRDGI